MSDEIRTLNHYVGSWYYIVDVSIVDFGASGCIFLNVPGNPAGYGTGWIRMEHSKAHPSSRGTNLEVNHSEGK